MWVEFVPPSTVCPKGAIFEHGQCMTVSKSSAEYICPDNAIMKGKKCEMLETVAPLNDCPKGFLLAGNICTRTDVYSADVICPKGYKNDKEGMCSRTIKCDEKELSECSSYLACKHERRSCSLPSRLYYLRQTMLVVRNSARCVRLSSPIHLTRGCLRQT